MPNVARGTTYNWPAYVRDGLGALSDPQELQVEVRDANNIVQAGFPQDLSGTIVQDGTGQYHVPWVIPVDQALGEYRAYWTGSLDGRPLAGVDMITVVLTATEPDDTPGMSYLTPERLRTLRVGVDFSSWSDLELAELITDAGVEIHSYCLAPLEGDFSFLGGTVTEEHTWRLPDHPFDGGQTRIYPRHWPVIEVTEVRMQLSANTYQTIPVSSFVKNDVERWIELSALVLTPGVFGISFFIFPLVALDRPVLRVTLDYGKTWERTERLYQVGDSLTYQAPDGFWTTSVPTVTADGVTVDSGLYSVDRSSGQITFLDENDVPAGTMVISYVTRLDRDIAKAAGAICGFLGARQTGPGRLLIGGVSRVRAGEVELSRGSTATRSSGTLIEDLAHDVPAAARALNGHRFWRIA